MDTAKLIRLLFSLGERPSPFPTKKFAPSDIVSIKLLFRMTIRNESFMASSTEAQQHLVHQLLEKHPALREWLARFQKGPEGEAAVFARLNLVWIAGTANHASPK